MPMEKPASPLIIINDQTSYANTCKKKKTVEKKRPNFKKLLLSLISDALPKINDERNIVRPYEAPIRPISVLFAPSSMARFGMNTDDIITDVYERKRIVFDFIIFVPDVLISTLF